MRKPLLKLPRLHVLFSSVDSASKYCGLLSEKTYSQLKTEDPLTTLKIITMSQTPTSLPSLGYPKAFNPEYFRSAQKNLLKQLKDKSPNVDIFQVLQEDIQRSSSLIILVKTFLNFPESAANPSLLAFLVEFALMLDQISQLLFDKQQLTEELKERRGLRQHHFDEYVTIKLEALSFNLHPHEENGMIQVKAFEAIEHHERAVTLRKLIESFVLEEEFVDLKLEICESLYEKLKANLRIWVDS